MVKRCQNFASILHCLATHSRQRVPCGALLKKVKSRNGRVAMVPRKPYPSLNDAISFLVSKPGFLDMCEQWRNRPKDVPDDILAGVYDGEVWKDFNSEK